MDQKPHSINDSELPFASPTCAPPICRQFWKAGSYDNGNTPKSNILRGGSHLHVHPKFLHSNATSHKWAFGAIAELLDNSIDQITNGATFAIVDKIKNPRDGSAALLIQDDGGGMDPDAIRCCLSFGFSDKKSSAIGKYGNGFKTSSMRLGADVVVFSRHLKDRKLTQSIGLLSYTFLTQTGHDRIVVPMVDYEFNRSTGSLEMLQRLNKENFALNLSMLMQWSPYSTEVELLKQFDDIGYGTKIVIYNLWFNDDSRLELNFDSNPEDICLHTEAKTAQKINARMTATEQHIATQFQYSLRVYLSILYIRIPENFKIILRGRAVEFHNIASDLKFPEYIRYKPQKGGMAEGEVLTSIGFLKEAPHVNIHGFSIYHKNRLILPFWRVLTTLSSVGRGVVGVLEANFIEPTHNKQDFERTPLFQKLEQRLKEMAREYWDYHCGLIGYHQMKTRPSVQESSQLDRPNNGAHSPLVVEVNPSSIATKATVISSGPLHPVTPSSNYDRELQSNLQGEHLKRKEQSSLIENKKEKIIIDVVADNDLPSMKENEEVLNLMQENTKLGERCLDAQKREEQLTVKLKQLEHELALAQLEYDRLVAEVQLVDGVQEEITKETSSPIKMIILLIHIC
ncbi:protein MICRORCHIDIA 6 isoform X2 [Impatiens glandulifera]|uniref:protein MICRORCHIDIA 6 isoform X2 n=1 Tax=Impatiens glandulifera TaxID=253017 RepID=UPI001FB13B4E|nr:protein MICRORCHIDIA 6 isoform X2 [Impatiens glandulifera]